MEFRSEQTKAHDGINYSFSEFRPERLGENAAQLHHNSNVLSGKQAKWTRLSRSTGRLNGIT